MNPRKLWQLLEPYHAVMYFAPECHEAMRQAGTKGYWMGYFAGRSAPMGEVAPGLVISTFFNFAPGIVRRAIPDAWKFSSVDAVLAARLAGVDEALRRVLGPELVDSAEMRHAADLAAQAVDEGVERELPARPLFAANADLDRPDAAHLRLWWAATCLREHRGDGHIACLLHAGLDGCEALVTASASGAVPREILQGTRAWTDAEWEAAVARLVDRGWVEPGGTFTDEGRARRQAIEDDTDRLAAPPYAALGAEQAAELGELLTPFAAAIVEAGVVPRINPMGARLN